MAAILELNKGLMMCTSVTLEILKKNVGARVLPDHSNHSDAGDMDKVNAAAANFGSGWSMRHSSRGSFQISSPEYELQPLKVLSPTLHPIPQHKSIDKRYRDLARTS